MAMSKIPRPLRQLLPVILSAVLLVVLIGYAPWSQVGQVLTKLSLALIILLLLLAMFYYALKAIRFWYMMRALGFHQPVGKVMLSYMSAQPITLLPAGELYRNHAFERHTGVPMRETIPSFTMQGLFEGAAMAIVGIISAIALGTLRLPALILTLLVAIGLIGVKAGQLKTFLDALNRIPFINIRKEHREAFSRGNQVMLERRWFSWLLILSIANELIGVLIALVAVNGLGGHINGFQAAFVYIVPVIVGFLSLLPAGLGASEQSSIGVLLLIHLNVALAVAATLLIRATLVGTGIIFGALATLAWRFKKL